MLQDRADFPADRILSIAAAFQENAITIFLDKDWKIPGTRRMEVHMDGFWHR